MQHFLNNKILKMFSLTFLKIFKTFALIQI